MPMPFEGVRRFLPLLESMLDRVALWGLPAAHFGKCFDRLDLAGYLISNEVQPSPCGSREHATLRFWPQRSHLPSTDMRSDGRSHWHIRR